MRPYWVKLAPQPEPSALNIGVGVTARSEHEARQMVSQAIGGSEVLSIEPVLDAAELDQSRVVPNMGSLLACGIWFPLGY